MEQTYLHFAAFVLYGFLANLYRRKYVQCSTHLDFKDQVLQRTQVSISILALSQLFFSKPLAHEDFLVHTRGFSFLVFPSVSAASGVESTSKRSSRRSQACRRSSKLIKIPFGNGKPEYFRTVSGISNHPSMSKSHSKAQHTCGFWDCDRVRKHPNIVKTS